MLLKFAFTLIAFIMTVRSLFVIFGGYKDPLLATFQHYGEERMFSPVVFFIIWSATFAYSLLYWYLESALAFGIGLMIIVPIMSLFPVIVKLVHKYDNITRKYPSWYYDLIQMTDREERRRVAYMWLFLPPSTRMTYNANNTLFWQWVEQVLVTVAQ